MRLANNTATLVEANKVGAAPRDHVEQFYHEYAQSMITYRQERLQRIVHSLAEPGGFEGADPQFIAT